MSVSLILLPLTVAITVTVSETILSETRNTEIVYNNVPSMQTVFNDAQLLIKTLSEHGLSPEVISDNRLIYRIGNARLDYARENDNEPFVLNITGVEDVQQLFQELKCLEKEYKENAQSFTYSRLISNLSENNMTIEKETILEDNSIVLTIAI